MAVEEHKKNDEAEIKRLIEGGVEASRALIPVHAVSA